MGSCDTREKDFDPTKPIYCFNSISAHKGKVVSLIELSSGNIATGSTDFTIKIWNIGNFKCEKTINVEGTPLCLLEFEMNILLSGTDKNNIELLNLGISDNDCMNKYEGHSLWVNCLIKCDENFFGSGSNDADIRIWNYKNLKCEKILKGHTNSVLSLIKLNNGKLCSGSADMTIKIWDWKENLCEATLGGNDDWIKCLYLLKNGNFLSGCNDGTIKIWENETNIGNLKGHTNAVRDFCEIIVNNDYYIASASFDETIKIWDLKTNKCINTLNGHKSNVIGIIYHSPTFLVSCSSDQTIKFWKNKKVENN